jgi:membrane fusion protein (multidrug efflux system)
VAALAVAGLVYWLMVRNWVSTDDAQVEGDLVPISSRVDGYVDRIEVDDNQEVSAGQVLVHLDRRDLQARLRSAQAAHGLQSAQAGAATTQVSLTARTATSGQEQAGASTSAAHSGVAAARTQVAAAEAQAEAVQAAADAALDAVAAAESEVETATAQIAAAQAAVEASDADVTSADAQAKKAASDAARFRGLYAEAVIAKEQLQATEATDVSAQSALKAARQRSNAARASLRQAEAGKVAAQAGTRQAKSRAASTQASADQARAAVRTAEAALSEAQARLSAARAAESGARTARQQIAISQSQRKAAAARLRQAAADVENASLLLSYTLITAPVSGVVSEKSVELGQYVQPGQLLMALVPLADVWVAANLKETQIGGMRAGQRAIIEVDAYRGISLAGRVNSIGAATGAKFSLLPPENATGNFVKVVQRIPVKIVLDRPLPKGVILRPGMNVIARVKVRGGG